MKNGSPLRRLWRAATSRPAAAGWAVFAVAFLLYANTLANRFAHDDHAIVEKNPRVVDADVAAGDIFSNPYWPPGYPQAQYRPLTILSFRLQHRLHGLTPWPYHLVNVLLFAWLSQAVVALLHRLGASTRVALGCGLLFAVHPIHTEAVAPVVGRSELLAALAVVVGSVAFIRATRAHAGRGRVGWGATTLVCFVLGLLSKENAIALAPLALVQLLLFDRPALRDRSTRWLLAALALVALSFVSVHFTISGGWRHDLLSQEFRVHNPLLVVAGGERILTSVVLLARYLRLLAVPHPLICDYTGASIEPVRHATDPRLALSLLVLATVFLLATRLRRDRRLAGFGMLFFAVTYAPVSQLPFPTGIIFAERLLLLPSMGLLLLPVLAAERITQKLSGRTPLAWLRCGAAVLLVGLAWTTVDRNRDWRDSSVLAFHDILRNPASPVLNYVCSIFANDARRIHEARAYAERAVQVGPAFASAHLALGVASFNQGDLETSEAHLRRATEIRPRNQKAWRMLAVVQLRRGAEEDAARSYGTLLELRPDHAEATRELVRLLVRTGGADEALARMERALDELEGDDDADRAWVELCGRMIVDGNLAGAAHLLEELVRRRPGLVGARVNLASAHRRGGDLERARSVYEGILRDFPRSEHARLAREQLKRLQEAR